MKYRTLILNLCLRNNTCYKRNGIKNGIYRGSYMKRLGIFLIVVIFLTSTINGLALSSDFNSKTEEFPRSYDLREQGRVTPVKAQGQLGSCWAVASIAALESTLKTLEGKEYDLSENNLITQLSDFYQESYNRGAENGGDDAISTGYFASWRGPVLEAEDPYPDNCRLENLVLRTGKKAIKHVQEVIFLPERDNALDNNLIKEHVMKYGAVSVTMWKGTQQTFGRFYNEEEFAWYYPHQYMNEEGNGHAVDIVGWDDDYPKENFKITPSGDGAFIVRNTKGPFWGQPDRKENMGGYFYISYYDGMIATNLDGNIGSSVFTRIDEIDNYDNIYQYDLLGYTKSIKGSTNTNEVWFSNVFDINQGRYEELSAVSFYTLEEDLSYEIWINEDYTSKSSLGNMKKIKTGKIRLPGYHTIDLDKKIELVEDSKVAVAIKLYSTKISPSIAIEAPNGAISNTANGERNQSFIKKNSYSSWWDILDYEADSNVCLKIFTDNEEIPEEELLTVEDMKGDVDFIVEWILTHQPVAKEEGYTQEQKEIIEYVYSRINEPMTENEFYLIINRLFTMMRDGHTILSRYPNNPKYLNIPFFWLEEGLIVDNTTERYTIGDKILSIGGKTPEELTQMLYEQIPTENDYWIRAKAPDKLTIDMYLQYYNLVNEDNTVDITIERDGKIIVFKQPLTSKKEISDFLDREWLTWHIEKENNLGYFQFDSWATGEKLEEIKDKMDVFFEEVAKNKIENIVFDIRENPGGSAGALNYLFKFLDVETVYASEYRIYDPANNYPKADESLIFDGDIYFMLSNRSFSCSIYATTILKDNGIVKVIGEPSGENPAFNRHGTGSDGYLPNTGWEFMMTSYRPQRPLDHDESEIAIFPDIPVYTTRDEVITGRDIQMERMREISREKGWIYTEETIEIDNGGIITLTQGEEFLINEGEKVDISLNINGLKKEDIWLEDTVNHNKVDVEIKFTSDGGEISIPKDLKKDLTYHIVINYQNKIYAILLSIKHDVNVPAEFRYVHLGSKYFYTEQNRLFLKFTKDLEVVHNSKITIKDSKGKTIKIGKVMFGNNKNYLFLNPSEKLIGGEEYTLIIPKGAIKSVDDEENESDIIVKFCANEDYVKFSAIEDLTSYVSKYNYIVLPFSYELKRYINKYKVSLVDSEGNKVTIKSVAVGSTNKYCFLVIPYKELDNGEEYTLHISKEAIESVYGDKNNEDIEIIFTAD